jgi:hypothetical protein
MTRRRRPMDPLTRLSIAMGAAALNIKDARCRDLAAFDAERIPKCNAEIGGGRKGEMARLGRSMLARLKDLPPEQFNDAVIVLRGCADAITARFEVTSEVSLGDRRRRHCG